MPIFRSLSSHIFAPMASTASPPVAPNIHVAVTKAAIALFGIIFARPQNVIGPPAAAVKRSVAAGAVPMPSVNKRTTRGISNNNGTLIKMPKVAAAPTPRMSLPR